MIVRRNSSLKLNKLAVITLMSCLLCACKSDDKFSTADNTDMSVAIKAMMGDDVAYETETTKEGILVRARGDTYLWKKDTLTRIHP